MTQRIPRRRAFSDPVSVDWIAFASVGRTVRDADLAFAGLL